MIRLFERSGSKEIQVLDQCYPSPEWEALKQMAVRLLEQRSGTEAADLLRKYPFVIHEGTNGFGDEFAVMYMQAPMALYVELGNAAGDSDLRRRWGKVAEAVGEVASKYIRFVAVELDPNDGTPQVPAPVLEITSDVVERALRDAEHLLVSQGATSGVDRVHTALHGYLRAVATRANLTVSDEASATELFKAIRQSHPRLQLSGPRHADIDKILRSLANITDALNPIRNQASVAHPNDGLLEEPEAMLVINAVKTLLHYVDSRLH